MMRVAVSPDLLRWARDRAGFTQEDLESKFPKLPLWETGDAQPTLRQVEALARALHVPVGYLFLSEPPEESIPIPDFRTIGNRTLVRPSPDLLDTVYACLDRQNWYREFARNTQQDTIDFVDSATVDVPPDKVAEQMRQVLKYQVNDRRECRSWTEALRLFIRQADDAGALVMVSGIVGNNTHRRLDPGEFRGFALSDPLAPLVFINGSDTKAAQMFTLAHELAHLWLGVSALSDLGPEPVLNTHREEMWCNAVAADFLVPLENLRSEMKESEPIPDKMSRLARIYKVSTLVVLRRLLDANHITRGTFDEMWKTELNHLRILAQNREGEGGGNFYKTTTTRVSRRFSRALVANTLEGQTLYRDAFRMLGISKVESFRKFSREIGAVR